MMEIINANFKSVEEPLCFYGIYFENITVDPDNLDWLFMGLAGSWFEYLESCGASLFCWGEATLKGTVRNFKSYE